MEDDLKELLWVYVGTDRPTFDLLFGKMRGSDIEALLRRIVAEKEADYAARTDALEAVHRSSVIRENRNTVLHKMRADHVDDTERVLPKLTKVRDDLVAHTAVLTECTRRLSIFVASRDALETYEDSDRNSVDAKVPEYQSVTWPPKADKVDLQDRK
ncbi:MAG: hypothetical protein ACE368_20140 [Paracoccaceae bacterium]